MTPAVPVTLRTFLPGALQVQTKKAPGATERGGRGAGRAAEAEAVVLTSSELARPFLHPAPCARSLWREAGLNTKF